MAKEARVKLEAVTLPEGFKGVCKRFHFDAEGKAHRSAIVGQVALMFLFTSGDNLLIWRDDISETIWEPASWHGFGNKVSDSFAGQQKSGDDPYETGSAMLEQLVAGNWVTESKATGPRIGLLVEAVVAAMTKAGKAADEAGIAERMRDKDHAKRAKANPAVAAEYERLVAERAAARYKAAAEKAKGTDAAGLDDI